MHKAMYITAYIYRLSRGGGTASGGGIGAGVNDRLLENGSHRLTEAGGARLLEL